MKRNKHYAYNRPDRPVTSNKLLRSGPPDGFHRFVILTTVEVTLLAIIVKILLS